MGFWPSAPSYFPEEVNDCFGEEDDQPLQFKESIPVFEHGSMTTLVGYAAIPRNTHTSSYDTDEEYWLFGDGSPEHVQDVLQRVHATKMATEEQRKKQLEIAADERTRMRKEAQRSLREEAWLIEHVEREERQAYMRQVAAEMAGRAPPVCSLAQRAGRALARARQRMKD